MEFLKDHPGDCTAFVKNPFKDENCKTCGQKWTYHKGIIDDETLEKLAAKKRQKDAEKQDKADSAKKNENTFENRQAAEKARRKKLAADSWYGTDFGSVEVNDDDDEEDSFAMQVITPSAQLKPDVAANNKTVIRNLLDNFDEMNVASPPVSPAIASTAPASLSNGVPRSNSSMGSMQHAKAQSFEADLQQIEMVRLQEELRRVREAMETAQFELEDKTIEFDILKDELQEFRTRSPKAGGAGDASAELEARIRERDEEIRNLQKEVEAFKVNAANPDAVGTPSLQLEEIESLKAAAAERELKLKEEIESINQLLVEKEAQVANAAAELKHAAAAQAQKEAAEQEIERLQEELRTARQANEMPTQLLQLEEELEARKASAAKKELALTEEISSISGRLVEKEADVARAAADLEKAVETQALKDAAEQEIDRLQDELRSARESFERDSLLPSQLEELEEELAALKASAAEREGALTQEITSINLLLVDKDAQVASAAAELKHAAETKAQKAIVEQEIVRLQEELRTTREALEKDAAVPSQLEQLEQKMKTREAKLKEELESVSDLLRKKEAEVARAERKTAEAPDVDGIKKEHSKVVTGLLARIEALKADKGETQQRVSLPQEVDQVQALIRENDELRKECAAQEGRRQRDRAQGALVAAQAFREVRQNAEQHFAWMFAKIQKAQADDIRRSTGAIRPSRPENERRSFEVPPARNG